MRKSLFPTIACVIVMLLANGSCRMNESNRRDASGDIRLRGVVNHRSNMPFDPNLLVRFYQTYPELNRYEKDVETVYKQHRYTHIWFDEGGVVEFGQTLYSKVKGISEEGISSTFPYQEKIDGIFDNNKEITMSPTETDLMLTNLYLYYAEKVYKGLDDTTVTSLGWLLPRKQVSYTALLDSVMSDTSLLSRDDSVLSRQYYKLRNVLLHYRAIEKKGGWNPIETDPKLKAFRPGDTAEAIRQVREHLFITGDIPENNGSNKYDPELVEAVMHYQRRHGYNPEKKITPKHIMEMNVPIGERIKTIIVNMERCRWIPPEFASAQAYIVVNIPAFKLNLFRNGKSVFESRVIVGTNLTKTVIFSGMLSYIVFSPYWNLPQSIVDKEVKPGMAKNKNYLEKHNMEWNKGQVRQKPGKTNSLGLVKFIFPNTEDIYLHDTPAKSLFAKENRAFSHGCIRVGKPGDLAVEVLQDDPDWTPQKIDAAMHAGKESTCRLKNKMPVHIGYFTAWVDKEGAINFYNDIYKLDEKLAGLLFDKNQP